MPTVSSCKSIITKAFTALKTLKGNINPSPLITVDEEKLKNKQQTTDRCQPALTRSRNIMLTAAPPHLKTRRFTRNGPLAAHFSPGSLHCALPSALPSAPDSVLPRRR